MIELDISRINREPTELRNTLCSEANPADGRCERSGCKSMISIRAAGSPGRFGHWGYHRGVHSVCRSSPLLSGNCLCLSQRDTAPRLLIKPAACVIARSLGQLTGCRFYDTYRLHSCSHAIREEILCDHRKQTLCSSSASPSFYEEFDDAARARARARCVTFSHISQAALHKCLTSCVTQIHGSRNRWALFVQYLQVTHV